MFVPFYFGDRERDAYVDKELNTYADAFVPIPGKEPIRVGLNPPKMPKVVNLLGKYKRFMPIAQAYAALSKYPGTKVGCVIVNTGSLEVRASGWNGAPRGCKADEDGRLSDRASRLMWAVHAEANAIANASRTGTPLLGGTAIVTHIPCMDCAKLMIQAGISGVVCNKPKPEFDVKWGSEFTLTRRLFKECGVSLLELEAGDVSK